MEADGVQSEQDAVKEGDHQEASEDDLDDDDDDDFSTSSSIDQDDDGEVRHIWVWNIKPATEVTMGQVPRTGHSVLEDFYDCQAWREEIVT